MTEQQTTQDGDQWLYRAEGNCSLVVYHAKTRVVYRLLKRLVTVEEGHDAPKRNCKQLLEEKLDFMENIMTPYLHPYVVHGEVVAVSHQLLQSIHVRCTTLRPEQRTIKEVDRECQFAIRQPDCCFVNTAVQGSAPCFGVEIKPKCGFITEFASAVLDDDGWQDPPVGPKNDRCSFCFYKMSKVQSGKWRHVSQYCPIDLFSGNRDRMKFALWRLFDTPQNNLRIFKNGRTIYSEQQRENVGEHLLPHFSSNKSTHAHMNCLRTDLKGAVDGFFDVVIEALLSGTTERQHLTRAAIHRRSSESVMTGSANDAFRRQCYKHSQTFTYPACVASRYSGEGTYSQLPKMCVLDQLLQTQMLCSESIEQIHKYYQLVYPHFVATHSNSSETCLFYKGCVQPPRTMRSMSLNEMSHCSLQSAYDKIKEFFISKAALDCSIMLAIQPLSGDELASNLDDTQIICSQDGCRYAFSVGVIDLDLKPFSKIPQYYEEYMHVKHGE